MTKFSLLFVTIIIIALFSCIPANAAEIHLNPVGDSTSGSDNSDTKILTHSTSSASLPSRYSSVELGYTSSVKQQNGNTCWGYSALATFESLLLKNNFFTSDLNIEHLDKWATPKPNGDGWQRIPYDSGYGYIAMGYFTSWQGPFTTDNTKVNIGATAIRYLSKNDPVAIKKAIMKNGAVVGDYNSIHRGNSIDQNSFFTKINSYAVSGHSISIVGWDDNYSKDNFNGIYTPENNGAWLCKNSWADYNSLGGYFWISYEDYYLLNDKIFTPGYTIDSYHIIEQNHNIYQHEEYGATYEFDYIQGSEKLTYYSMYDFSEKGNLLDKVVFETEALGADYSVYYTPVKDNFPVEDRNQWYKLKSGKVDYKGYLCCDFEDIIISQSKGAIAVEIDTSEINRGLNADSKYYTPNTIGVCEWLRDASSKKIIFTKQSIPGECFVSYHGTTMDLYNFYTDVINDKVGGTFAIKAITTDVRDTTILGDINFDQQVNINDATYLQKYLVNYTTKLMEHQQINADFNKDGSIDIRDVTSIRKHIAKIEQ